MAEGVELNGADPFTNMHPEFGLRFEAAQRGQHAPQRLCECSERDGVTGTFVLKTTTVKHRFYGKTYNVKRMWSSFEHLDTTQKRMACYGAGQSIDGGWCHLCTGIPIASHIKAKRTEKLKILAWRNIPNVIWAVFRMMETAAKRAEERRIAQIAEVLAAPGTTAVV